MTFKASWGRCSMGQTISVHTNQFDDCSPPFDELNGGELCVFRLCTFRLSVLLFYNLLCVICFSLSFSLICFSSDLLSIVLSLG